MKAARARPVPKHYGCNQCFEKLEESQIKIFESLFYCWECYDAKARRKRLLEAEKEFDESPDETIE